MFLVLGSSLDPHVSSVCDILIAKGLDVQLLDYENPSRFAISFSNVHEDIQLLIGDKLCFPKLVWFRSKLRLPNYVSDNNSRSEFSAASEWLGTIHGLKAIYADLIVPTPIAISLNQHKLYQARVASKSGFNVPPSLMSNEREACLKFSSENDDKLIVKSIGPGVIPHRDEGHLHEVLMTMEITREDLLNHPDSDFVRTPSFLQRNIGKKAEYRVQVVGKDVFPFIINSQDYRVTQTDWRYGNFFLNFQPTSLPENIIVALLLFMEDAGLQYGSVDLIEDESGEFWFLECNPDGQWKWLDPIVDNAISEAFADLFLSIYKKREAVSHDVKMVG